MNTWTLLATEEEVMKTINALHDNGIEVMIASDMNQAREKILTHIPKGSQIMTMNSKSLEDLQLNQEFETSGRYQSVKMIVEALDTDYTKKQERQQFLTAPEWVIGSAQAITMTGHIYFASRTGGQLPAYLYGSLNVVLVVGTHKIVADDTQAMDRIYDYWCEEENRRSIEKLKTQNSVNKIGIINRETKKGRITVIFVKEKVGI